VLLCRCILSDVFSQVPTLERQCLLSPVIEPKSPKTKTLLSVVAAEPGYLKLGLCSGVNDKSVHEYHYFAGDLYQAGEVKANFINDSGLMPSLVRRVTQPGILTLRL
jgi:hypothetical protein